MRAGLHGRASTHDQPTLGLQALAMAAYIEDRGRAASKQIEDVCSGSKMRPMCESLLGEARRRDVDVVVVWRHDGWGRSVVLYFYRRPSIVEHPRLVFLLWFRSTLMQDKSNLQIKSVFPERRARQVQGIPLEDLKQAAQEAEVVRWFNGADFLAEISAKDFQRRLNAMPAGCEVVVMAKTSRSQRAFPVDTGYSTEREKCLDLSTSYLY